jgi:hypothetical protein
MLAAEAVGIIGIVVGMSASARRVIIKIVLIFRILFFFSSPP